MCRTAAIRTGVIIAAGGSSRRYGAEDKLLARLDGIPLFLHCVRSFAPVCAPGAMVAAVREEALEEYRALAQNYLPEAGLRFVPGGATRTGSVRNALAALPPDCCDVIAVHDAARPFATAELLETLARIARETGGALAAKPVTDSLKRTEDGSSIAAPVTREMLWRAETPQVFDAQKFRDAYARISGDYSDDAEVMRMAGYPVQLFHHRALNPKLTTAEELPLFSALLRQA